MAVGMSLLEMRTMLLAETTQSLHAGQSLAMRDAYNVQLRRTQDEQWLMFEWPHLRLDVDINLQPGVRHYDYPPGVAFENILGIHYPVGNLWNKMSYGIKPETYSAFGGENVQSWPPLKWQSRAGFNPETRKTDPFGKIEVWPVPNREGTLRVVAQAPVNPLVDDADTSVIDGTLIVLFAAAEILANQKSEGAQIKLQKAQQYQRKLLQKLGGQKRDIRTLSGAGGSTTGAGRRPTPYLDYIPS